MINAIIKWIIFAGLIMFIAWFVPGISVENFMSAMIVCVVIALINAIVRPILEFISMPVNVLTLGLFSFVINALLLMLAGAITPGFYVNGFLSALFGSILLAIFTPIIDRIGKK